MSPADPLALAIAIARHLDAADLRYVIGGSVASSLIGEPRSTLDLDVMIERNVDKTRALVRRLSGSCYVEEETAVAAAREGGSFNAIDLDSAMKIDFFIAEEGEFVEQAFIHRRRVDLPEYGVLFVYAAEDLIVRKLLWFRMGGETSERQWRDVAGLMTLNREHIDRDRLRVVSRLAGVTDLLDRAIAETTGR